MSKASPLSSNQHAELALHGQVVIPASENVVGLLSSLLGMGLFPLFVEKDHSIIVFATQALADEWTNSGQALAVRLGQKMPRFS